MNRPSDTAARPAWRFDVSPRRIALAHAAAVQIAALSTEIALELEGQSETLAESMAIRVAQLADAVIAALGDEAHEEADIHWEVFHRHLEEEGEPRHG